MILLDTDHLSVFTDERDYSVVPDLRCENWLKP